VNHVALLSRAENRPGRTPPTAGEDVPRLVRDLVEIVEGVVPLPVAGSAGWTLATDLVGTEPLPCLDQSLRDFLPSPAHALPVPLVGTAVHTAAARERLDWQSRFMKMAVPAGPSRLFKR
jgi:hypothetical protein